MPDETGLRGLLMSARFSANKPKTGADVNLPDENPKRKKKNTFLDKLGSGRSQADQDAIASIGAAIRGGQKK